MTKSDLRILFKACQTCDGDLYHNEDQYGAYYQCLQCARIVELDPECNTQGKEVDQAA